MGAAAAGVAGVPRPGRVVEVAETPVALAVKVGLREVRS